MHPAGKCVCVSVKGTTVICSNTHTNAANRAQTDEVPGIRTVKKKEKKQIPAGKQWKVGKGREGEQLDLFTSILHCGIGFDQVVSVSNFCLKV